MSLIIRLRRVLRGIGWLYPDLGYCQGVGVIASILLLLLEEEDAFWLLCAIVEDLLPASYYTPSLIGNFHYLPLIGRYKLPISDPISCRSSS